MTGAEHVVEPEESDDRATARLTRSAAWCLALGVAASGGGLLLAGRGQLWGLGVAVLGVLLSAVSASLAPSAALRRVGVLVAVGSGAAVLASFTVRVGVSNVVVAGQKAAGRAAVGRLRTLVWAQDRFIAAMGRAGTLDELTGHAPVAGGPGPILREGFDARHVTAGGDAVVVSGGFVFAVFPLSIGEEGREPLDETPPPSARDWIAYAWAEAPGATGFQAFCVNGQEDLLESLDGGARYEGIDGGPEPDACRVGPGPRLLPGTGRDGAEWSWWRGRQTRRSRGP